MQKKDHNEYSCYLQRKNIAKQDIVYSGYMDYFFEIDVSFFPRKPMRKVFSYEIFNLFHPGDLRSPGWREEQQIF